LDTTAFKYNTDGSENSEFKKEYLYLVNNATSGNIIVLFTREFNRSWRFPNEKELMEMTKIEPSKRFKDSVIF
jgi:hypothetical protein